MKLESFPKKPKTFEGVMSSKFVLKAEKFEDQANLYIAIIQKELEQNPVGTWFFCNEEVMSTPQNMTFPTGYRSLHTKYRITVSKNITSSEVKLYSIKIDEFEEVQLTNYPDINDRRGKNSVKTLISSTNTDNTLTFELDSSNQVAVFIYSLKHPERFSMEFIPKDTNFRIRNMAMPFHLEC